MADFIDTPLGQRFFEVLPPIGEIFRDELGDHCQVEAASLRGGMGIGGYPGLRVRGRRQDGAPFWHDLDVFLHWAVPAVAAYLGSEDAVREAALERLRWTVRETLDGVLNSAHYDLATLSQGKAGVTWIEMPPLVLPGDEQTALIASGGV